MSIYFKTDKTKLNINNNYLFDVSTKSTGYGRDLDINSNGGISRVIGLDKLIQQVQKTVLVKKASYPSLSSFGTALSGMTTKDVSSIDSDIKGTLATYAGLQQQQHSSTSVEIIGRNVYRTIDINDSASWIKLNSQIVTKGSYLDSNLATGTTYYYATTTVYRDYLNRTVESNIKVYSRVNITNVNTQSAEVKSEFVLINGANKVTLYWMVPIGLTQEEQLRSVLGISTTKSPGEPRRVRIDIKLTNRNLTATQLNVLSK